MKDIRPTDEQKRIGKEKGWSGKELHNGYCIANSDDWGNINVIERIDDMGTFDSDEEDVGNNHTVGAILKDFVKEGDLIEMANGKRGPDRYTESRVTLWELNPDEYVPENRIINISKDVLFVVYVSAYDSGRVYLTKDMNEAVDFAIKQITLLKL